MLRLGKFLAALLFAGTIGLAQFVNAARGDPNAMPVGGMVMIGGGGFHEVAEVIRLVRRGEI
jgi:hypothetical protein